MATIIILLIRRKKYPDLARNEYKDSYPFLMLMVQFISSFIFMLLIKLDCMFIIWNILFADV